MKKFISLTLAVILALALCLPAAARYMHCEWCIDGKVMTETVKTQVGTVQCDLDPSKTDIVYLYEKVKSCDSCDYSEVLDSYEEVYCRH